jgi:hypothetical protein
MPVAVCVAVLTPVIVVVGFGENCCGQLVGVQPQLLLAEEVSAESSTAVMSALIESAEHLLGFVMKDLASVVVPLSFMLTVRMRTLMPS